MKLHPASRVALALSLTCLPLVAEAQAPKVDPALAKWSKDIAAAYSGKDAAKVASFYTQDAMLMPPNEPAVRGRAAIQAWVQRMFDQGTVTLALTPMESAISGNIGYQAENYTFTMKPTTGAAMTDKGKSLVVFKQVGGKWLMAHDIFNSDMPPPTPPPAKPAK
jgi:ketosteroid isomerase-like protein